MTDKTNNGGPAFPQNDLSGYGMGPAECNNGGMSLRDWFAGQALPGLLAGYYCQTTSHNLGEVPAEAYKIAEAMLEARK